MPHLSVAVQSRRAWAFTPQVRREAPFIFQVGGVEALGEPAVDFGEHSARFVTAFLLREQTRKTDSCAQFQRLSVLATRDLYRGAKAVLSLFWTGLPSKEQDLSS